MALDIRLDFINGIKQLHIDEMTKIRKEFIALDNFLVNLADQAQECGKSAASRTIALARTYNEQALQSTIKSLCILGEKL